MQGKDSRHHYLKDYSTYHIKKIVQDIMEDKKVNQEKWGAKLLEYTLKAVENVRPSSRYMSDSMVFNQFIKIKLINWEYSSKSAYINGMVISKNLSDKRMRTDVDNPQILLLKEPISTTVRTVVTGV